MSERVTVAFDVYGTLINTHGLIGMLQQHVGSNAAPFSRLWREKQLEYSFRRGLMQKYRDFGICTAQALDYASLAFGVALTEQEKEDLLSAYRALPAFDDVISGLEVAKDAGFRLFAFSNGTASDIARLLDQAGIGRYFLDIISVDEVHSFKPDPAVYRHFLDRSSSQATESWLVSANPFDVIGARAAEMHAVWLQRSPEMLMDPWEIQPTLTIKSLAELQEVITSRQNR
ncbi:haloacid dehalogenase type II [Chlorobium ferrooxidans]|uniref:Haloacid dehalogenase, type II:HAD-superfamily hydrolase, subfamily IA, variant 2 n=1 Tax=Chlorobium ferrooxidans DSM 13031 TaxID=377431 RepID=Q0YRH0_9CHLB|nr:haloacid dehalogenase type II [Chlorobium ferrooxidans]EAT58924.1 haloacid dehalogenase, type II:HAD-superfamily hydrolase, subfamily IA, variant 2 [Chlorobium ferrooxidans DSM 13031]